MNWPLWLIMSGIVFTCVLLLMTYLEYHEMAAAYKALLSDRIITDGEINLTVTELLNKTLIVEGR